MQPLVLGPLVAECNDRLSSLRRHAESCADLGCWVRSTSVLTEQFLKTQNPQIGALLGKEALVFSGLRQKYDDPQPLSPLTHFIGSLWAKLAINARRSLRSQTGFESPTPTLSVAVSLSSRTSWPM